MTAGPTIEAKTEKPHAQIVYQTVCRRLSIDGVEMRFAALRRRFRLANHPVEMAERAARTFVRIQRGHSIKASFDFATLVYLAKVCKCTVDELLHDREPRRAADSNPVDDSAGSNLNHEPTATVVLAARPDGLEEQMACYLHDMVTGFTRLHCFLVRLSLEDREKLRRAHPTDQAGVRRKMSKAPWKIAREFAGRCRLFAASSKLRDDHNLDAQHVSDHTLGDLLSSRLDWIRNSSATYGELLGRHAEEQMYGGAFRAVHGGSWEYSRYPTRPPVITADRQSLQVKYEALPDSPRSAWWLIVYAWGETLTSAEFNDLVTAARETSGSKPGARVNRCRKRITRARTDC